MTGGHSHHHHHHHHHGHSHVHVGSGEKAVLWGLIINLTFTLIEIVGGLATGSIAILADAVHDFGDSITLALAWRLERYSQRHRDADYSFGYRRFSLLSALISGVVIFSGSLLVLRESIPRLWNPGEPHARGMMGLAVLGLVFNGVAAYRLSRGKSQNERMLSWHFWEDTLGWLGTLLAAILIAWKGWALADPILAIGLSVFVMRNVYRELKSTLRLFLQGTPVDFERDKFVSELKNIAGVQDVHDLHVWSLDGENHVVSMHAVLKNDAPAHTVKKSMQAVARLHGIRHVTIETESSLEDCIDNCDDENVG